MKTRDDLHRFQRYREIDFFLTGIIDSVQVDSRFPERTARAERFIEKTLEASISFQ
jgi:hypothetical protein